MLTIPDNLSRTDPGRPEHWTAELVSDWIEEAVETESRLPGGLLKACASSWPGEPLRDWQDIWSQAVERGRYEDMKASLGPPQAIAIDRMDEVFMDWLPMISDAKIRRLVRARAEGIKWVQLARKFRKDRRTLKRWYIEACLTIADRLNGGAK